MNFLVLERALWKRFGGPGLGVYVVQCVCLPERFSSSVVRLRFTSLCSSFSCSYSVFRLAFPPLRRRLCFVLLRVSLIHFLLLLLLLFVHLRFFLPFCLIARFTFLALPLFLFHFRDVWYISVIFILLLDIFTHPYW